MVRFGATLREQRHKDWAPYYIDYNGLKRQLKILKAAYNDASAALWEEQAAAMTHNTSNSINNGLEHAGGGTRVGGDNDQHQHMGGQREGRGGSSSNDFDEFTARHGYIAGKGRSGCNPEASPMVGSVRFLLSRRLSHTGVGATDPTIDRLEDDFSWTLDSEVEKVVLFFLAKQGDLARQLLEARKHPSVHGTSHHQHLQQQQQHHHHRHTQQQQLQLQSGGAMDDRSTGNTAGGGSILSNPSSPSGRYAFYCEIGRQIVLLMKFLQLNVSGLRKILKKHDKQVRDKLITNHYLTSRANEKYSTMRQLYNNEGIMALVASLRNAFAVAEAERIPRKILEAEELQEDDGYFHSRDIGSGITGGGTLGDVGSGGGNHYMRWTRSKDRSLSEMSSTHGVFVDIANAQRALADAQRQTVSNYLSLQVLMAPPMGSVDEDEGSESGQARELNRPSAYINLATTFLYMTNYYIVGPTSAEYAAALGGSPAVSGMIIGMTPIAACFSCLLYSWWTNTSFKGPLLLCSWMLVAGNLLYGMALSYDAFWMVLVGRTLIGLGGARGVNRRYIADTIPMADRTAYSAAFVAAGALGMAFGPFTSAVMTGVDFNMGVLIFNSLTNPGWSMFVCWVVMAILVQFLFQEPPHYIRKFSPGSDEETPEPTPARSRGKRLPPPSALSTTRGPSYGATEDPASARLLAASSLNGNDVAAEAGRGEESRLLSDGGGGGTSNGGLGGRGNDESTDTGVVAVVVGAGGEGEEGNINGVAAADGEHSESAQAGERKSRRRSLSLFNWGGDNRSGDSDDMEEEAMDEEFGGEKGGEKGARRGGGVLSAITPPLKFCLFGYFVNKLVVEMVVSSGPVLTQYNFDWSVSEVGVLTAVLGLVVLPVNVIVGRMSLIYEDRVLLQMLALLSGIGCLIIVDISAFLPSWYAYSQAQYVAGVSLVFVALQAHEGVIMSITSKIIPLQLARGTWNSGFLATEAGTFGRFVGDAFITAVGVVTLEWLDALLFIPAVVMVTLMFVGFKVVYPFLEG